MRNASRLIIIIDSALAMEMINMYLHNYIAIISSHIIGSWDRSLREIQLAIAVREYIPTRLPNHTHPSQLVLHE